MVGAFQFVLITLALAAEYTLQANQDSGTPLGESQLPFLMEKMKTLCDGNDRCCGFTTRAQMKQSCGQPTPTPPIGGSSFYLKIIDSDDQRGLSGGSIFLIILVVLLFVYCAGGITYNIKVKGASGAESVPNIAFWQKLPGLVKDGCLFTKSKLMKSSSSG